MVCSRVFGSNSGLFRTPNKPNRRGYWFAPMNSQAPRMNMRLPRSSNCETTGNSWRTICNLPDDKRRVRGQIDPHLAIARAKIEEAETFERGAGLFESGARHTRSFTRNAAASRLLNAKHTS